MNECFFIGNIIEIGKFKFILNPKIKYKSKIQIKVKLFDGNLVDAVAYDETADYILRNNFYNTTVFIQGKVRNEENKLNIKIYYIKKL